MERLALLAPGGLVHIRFGAILRAAPLLLLGPWGHRKALDVDMGFSADDARAENNDFLNLFSLVQSGFVARMQMLPRLSDTALKTLTMPILAVLGGKDSLLTPRLLGSVLSRACRMRKSSTFQKKATLSMT